MLLIDKTLRQKSIDNIFILLYNICMSAIRLPSTVHLLEQIEVEIPLASGRKDRFNMSYNLERDQTMTPEMYEMWDKHNSELRESACELTPEQEAEWESRNAIDSMSAIANHSKEDAVVERKRKKKKDSISTDKKDYGILYAEKKQRKKAISQKRKQNIFHSRNARMLKRIIPIWSKAREGAGKRYRTLKYSKLIVEGD